MGTWLTSLKGLLNRTNTSNTALFARLAILYVALILFSPIFQSLLFAISSSTILRLLASILNALGITSYAHKYMLTTSYNTVLLTWGNMPYVPLFAALALFVWLEGNWKWRLWYALSAAAIIKLLFFGGLIMAVFQPADQVQLNFNVLHVFYFGLILAIARQYVLHNVRLETK